MGIVDTIGTFATEHLLGDALGRTLDVATLGFGLLAGVLGYFVVSRPAARREERIERSQAYLQLELASIEVFKYRAAHWYAMDWALTGKNPKKTELSRLEEEADQYFYQCLNLFEIASRFRKVEIIEKQIYASWVAWFYEALEVPHFRKQWRDVYRDNYTPELQDIFDAGVKLWPDDDGLTEAELAELGSAGDDGSATDKRRRRFYQHVGWVLACPIIADWPDRKRTHIGPAGTLLRAYYRMKPSDIE